MSMRMGRFSSNVSMILKDSGAVRQVLDDWSFPPAPVHAVMTSRLVPARVRALVDFLASVGGVRRIDFTPSLRTVRR
jgi:hypothetical protein